VAARCGVKFIDPAATRSEWALALVIFGLMIGGAVFTLIR
jgi:hypothetical protein